MSAAGAPLPSPTAEAAYAFLVRHGATPASAAEPAIMQGRGVDAALSEVGRRQAAETGAFLAATRLAAVYASPMRRALETAQAIAGPQRLSVTHEPALIEADLGTWEGLTWPQIAEREPEQYRQFIDRPDVFGYGGGESITNVRDRALVAVERLLAAHAGQAIAIVTHRIVIRACAAALVGLPLASARNLSPSTCGISLLRAKAGKLELVTFNSVTHLSTWR